MGKQNANEVNFTDDIRLQAILESEASILADIGKMFSIDSKENGQQGFIQIVSGLDHHDMDIVKIAELIETFLCAIASKEFAVADVINSIACYKAVKYCLIKDGCKCCDC